MIKKFFIKGIRKFNEECVTEAANRLSGLKGYSEIDVKRFFREPQYGERQSCLIVTFQLSTQGFNIIHLVGGPIIVELPWLASEMDIRMCYIFLNAVKNVHRAARITDENDDSLTTTDEDADKQWELRRRNMNDLICKGDTVVISGVNRDFHLDPARYKSTGNMSVMEDEAFMDFIRMQWETLDARALLDEKRHVADDEELSSLQVIDNSSKVFIGVCRFVGMMKGNTCKMIEFDDFCNLMKDEKGFKLMDAAQAVLEPVEPDRWDQLFREAKGILKECFRKTFIMRWNTDISNYKMEEFDSVINEFHDEGFYYDWSIWDHTKAHLGDRFYMIRTGEGRNGIVMRGTIIGTPYPDEDWSGRGRKVYYVRMKPSHMIHPDKSPLLFTTEELTQLLPDFNWTEGHSGVMLEDSYAQQLEELWHSFVAAIHDKAQEGKLRISFFESYKERYWAWSSSHDYVAEYLDSLLDPKGIMRKKLDELERQSSNNVDS